MVLLYLRPHRNVEDLGNRTKRNVRNSKLNGSVAVVAWSSSLPLEEVNLRCADFCALGDAALTDNIGSDENVSTGN